MYLHGYNVAFDSKSGHRLQPWLRHATAAAPAHP